MGTKRKVKAKPLSSAQARWQVRVAQRQLAAAERAAEEAREKFAAALDAANTAGMTLRDLEDETGLTFGRVAQIIRGARGEGPGR